MKSITPDDLRALTNETADPSDRVEALTRLTHWERGKYDHLEPTIAALLRDPNASVRGAAIKPLLGWGREQYLNAAIEMLRGPYDEEVWSDRGDAAWALGQFVTRQGRQRERVLRELVAVLRTDPDWSVQASCYRAAYRILNGDLSSPPPDDDKRPFDRERDVDWELLRPYVPA